MSLADIHKARRPQQAKVAKPPLIPAHIRAALAADRAKAPHPRAPSPEPARPRPAPAKPTQTTQSFPEYWERRRAEDTARGQATMAAIAQAADGPQTKPVEPPNPDPIARVTAEVVQAFVAALRGGQR